jgi:hypothetical protein
MRELPILGETYTSNYPTKSAKWVKAIYNTCKGSAAKLREPVDLNYTIYGEAKKEGTIGNGKGYGKRNQLKRKTKKGRHGNGGLEKSHETAFVMIRAPKSLMVE